jgi:hypothetical protein
MKSKFRILSKEQNHNSEYQQKLVDEYGYIQSITFVY